MVDDMSVMLTQQEVEHRINFDKARAKYIKMYGESIFDRCQSCNGIGLANLQPLVDSVAWDGSSYCSDCDGFGGKFVLGAEVFECDHCKHLSLSERKHCKKCNGTGFVDWIENILFGCINYNWNSRGLQRTGDSDGGTSTTGYSGVSGCPIGIPGTPGPPGQSKPYKAVESGEKLKTEWTVELE